MTEPALLLRRLEEIGQSLAGTEHALCLLGLGSVGSELDRLDVYSDLDFFVVVEAGYKQAYLNDLHWLSGLCPIDYAFLNTDDGYKLLFSDGVFCEFAIFEPDELARADFAPGRIVWKRAGTPAGLGHPLKPAAGPVRHNPERALGEAITNLYVGLGRDRRGEKLSATRFIQGYAVDRLLELAASLEEPQAAHRDFFANERRFETRFPDTAQHVASWMQGYDRNRESALAILAFLEQHFEVNAAIAKRIRDLAA